MRKLKLRYFILCCVLFALLSEVLSEDILLNQQTIEQALVQIVELSISYDKLILVLKKSISSLEQELMNSKQELQSLKDLLKVQKNELVTLQQESGDLKKELEKQLNIVNQLLQDYPELKVLLQKWEEQLKIKDLTVGELVLELESKLKSCEKNLTLSRWVMFGEGVVIVVLAILYALTFIK